MCKLNQLKFSDKQTLFFTIYDVQHQNLICFVMTKCLDGNCMDGLDVHRLCNNTILFKKMYCIMGKSNHWMEGVYPHNQDIFTYGIKLTTSWTKLCLKKQKKIDRSYAWETHELKSVLPSKVLIYQIGWFVELFYGLC